jgi:hypothetical protein
MAELPMLSLAALKWGSAKVPNFKSSSMPAPGGFVNLLFGQLVTLPKIKKTIVIVDRN